MNRNNIFMLACFFLFSGIGRWLYVARLAREGCPWIPDLVTLLFVGAGIVLVDIYRLKPSSSHTIKTLAAQYMFHKVIPLLGGIVYLMFKISSKNCIKQQTNVLMDILKRNRATKFAKDYGLSQLASVDEYRKQMPLTCTKNYIQYVDLVKETGAADILFPGKVDFLATTSGTTSGKSKFYPKSPEVRKFILTKVLVLCQKMILGFANQSLLKKQFIVKVASKLHTSNAGINYGSISALLNKNSNLSFHVTPPNDIQTEQESLYVELVFGLSEDDLTSLSTVTSSTTFSLFNVLRNHWESICDDIERGAISDKLKISPEQRATLNGHLICNPSRANHLRSEFRKGLDGIAPRVWKGLHCVFAIGTGTFKTKTSIVRNKYLDGLPFVSLLHIGTETIYGMNFDVNSKEIRFVALTNINFFEFIPEDEIDKENPKTLLANEVVVGEVYEVVITTYEGLYRYRSEDVVLVTGFFETVPKYKFLRRAGDILSVGLEKVPEILLFESVYAVADQWQSTNIVDFTSVENHHVEKITGNFSGSNFYIVFMEVDAGVTLSESDTENIDSELRKRHVVYSDMRECGKLQPVKVAQVRPTTFRNVQEMIMSTNPNSYCMQYKQPRIVRRQDVLKYLLQMSEL